MSSYTTLQLLCDSIFGINKNIQSVAVINNRGRMVEKISKVRFSALFPDFFNELFCMHHILQVSLGRDFDENYGPVNYHISERTSLTTLSLPVRDIVILVTINKNTSPSPITLARKVVNMIDDTREHSIEFCLGFENIVGVLLLIQ